jgi:hypothetical protein
VVYVLRQLVGYEMPEAIRVGQFLTIEVSLTRRVRLGLSGLCVSFCFQFEPPPNELPFVQTVDNKVRSDPIENSAEASMRMLF